MRRTGLQNLGGPKPQWRFTKKTGKIERNGKGGIDAYRYAKYVFKPKLVPFALECMKDRPNTIVQEDKAPAHAAAVQQAVYSISGAARMFWPGNSPDLNMIEPCWPWMKRRTTRRGAPQTRITAERVWSQAWKNLEQTQIQAWIKRIK